LVGKTLAGDFLKEVQAVNLVDAPLNTFTELLNGG
jgi:hypothetical protein